MAASLSLSTINDSMEQATIAHITGYETSGKTNDANSISAHLAPDCRRTFASRAFIESSGMPPGTALTNEQYQTEWAKQMPIWTVMTTEISNLTIDAGRRTAAARVKSDGEFIDGTKQQVEFAWFLDFNDDGTKITHIVQYVDPVASKEFTTKAKSLKAKIAAEKATEN